jgi:hypothetical protein
MINERVEGICFYFYFSNVSDSDSDSVCTSACLFPSQRANNNRAMGRGRLAMTLTTPHVGNANSEPGAIGGTLALLKIEEDNLGLLMLSDKDRESIWSYAGG